MRRYRIGIFGWKSAPVDGGSDTIFRTLHEKISGHLSNDMLEIMEVPWPAWDRWRQPLWYLRHKISRYFGGVVPPADLRPVCRRFRLDAAYFATPSFAHIDIPFIFSLWDIGHRVVPEFPEMRRGPGDWKQREALHRQMLAQASFVVTGNNIGAAEARELFGLNAGQVIAIPFPNPDFSSIRESAPSWMPERPFFFYPAQGWPHKNHYTLLKALAVFPNAGKALPDLVFVGSDKGNFPYLKSVAASLRISERVHFAGFVSRGEIKALYRRAVALVFPSMLGPNNLPPQEAASLGCPVIMSDLPGHREQLGAGAFYVPPLDAQAWGDAMLKLMTNTGFRLDLAARAKAVVATYSAEAYISRLTELFSSLVATRALWGDEQTSRKSHRPGRNN
jgi:glycosyltransferase involved in cell wall biosynthesis